MIFIAPKNFKSGRLLANKYTWFDLMLMCIGLIVTIVLEALFVIFFISDNAVLNVIIFATLAIPAMLIFGLVQPKGIYHNFLTFFELMFIDMKSPKRYIWGGLMRNGIEENETIDTDR